MFWPFCLAIVFVYLHTSYPLPLYIQKPKSHIQPTDLIIILGFTQNNFHLIHYTIIERSRERKKEEREREREAMAGLQRSAVSFRRQGSSGLVWDDRLLSGELNQVPQKEDQQDQPQAQGSADQQDQKPEALLKEVKAPRPINTVERSRSNGGARGYRTGRVSPAIEPPSPKVSACGFCCAFRKPSSKNRRPKTTAAGAKRRSRKWSWISRSHGDRRWNFPAEIYNISVQSGVCMVVLWVFFVIAW